jgi:tetratricopeptide (TPR) repeat protein
MYYLAMLSDDLFRTVDAVLDSESPADALEMLAGEFRACGRYDLLFEARTMRKRVDLGLPLVQTEPSSSFPDEVRTVYDQAVIAAAREAGELYLAAGNIPSGWRYLRAIGELAPVAAAIENAQPDEDLDELIAIAFQEGVHPLKGLELILRNQGICRAITALGMQAVEKDREACIDLLIRELHSEAVERIRKTVEQQEGAAPQENCLPGLMQGRPWLFGEYDYYVDTSHLTSLLPYCLEVTKVETLQLLDELCEYGKHLSPNFAFRGSPPFEDGYVDYGHYIKAMLRPEEDEHLRHFYEKAANPDPETTGSAPAQLLVSLLARLERFEEALDIFLQYLANENPGYLTCPTALDLCYRSRNYERMRHLARERGDVLSYTAAQVMAKGTASIGKSQR